MSIIFHQQKCVKISGTTSGTIGTQTSHAINGIPIAVLIVSKSNGVVYLSADADKDNIYVKGSAASLNFDALLFY